MQENTGTQSAVEESAEAAADSDTGAEQSDEKPAAEATAHSTTDPSEDESELPSSVSLPEKTLDHVAGMSELESTIRERIIDPVVDERYERYGAETPTGVLLHGPPGSGKTHLAESITGEIDYRLIEITASNLLSSDFGGSEQNISKLFDLASQAAPAVVFIDEFDALAADRDGESHSATQRIVNELLSQLSNLNESDDDVIVIAATNRLDSIDPAIKRSGRFDETIEVTLPNAETRSAILQSELEDGPPVELTREEVQEIVDRTDGFSSSDMVELADRTIRRTIRDTDPDDTPVVTVSDLSEVVPEIEDKKQQDTGAAQLLEEAPDRDLDDVAGMASLKSELREKVLSPLQTPEQFEEYGLDVTNGVLLYGPPGTGKTYTTRALAGELGFDFVSVTASDVTSKYIGEGAQNIREVFEVALGNQPCIVFVDEIDAIGGSRAGSGQMSNSEQQMVTELLTGLNEVQDEEVVVVAATNQRDRLDPALTRSGRFDAEIEVPPPTAETRTAILEHHLEGRPVAEEEIDWQRLAEMTRTDVDGNPFVASDLKLIADTAARYAMTRNRSSSDETGTGEIQQEDIERAVENTTSSLA